MQYIIILSVIIVLLIALGVSLQLIANVSAWGILALCSLLAFAMTAFFAVYMVKLFGSKRAKGSYIRTDFKDNGRFKRYRSAVYEIDGKEHFGVFPADIKAFYRTGRQYSLLIDKNGFVYDRVIRITIIAGLILSVLTTAGLVVMTIQFLYFK